MFIIICTGINESGETIAVPATSLQFDTVELAQKYAATISEKRNPVVLDLNDFL